MKPHNWRRDAMLCFLIPFYILSVHSAVNSRKKLGSIFPRAENQQTIGMTI